MTIEPRGFPRRRVLKLVGAGGAMLIPGCNTGRPNVPPGMRVDTRYWESNVLDDGIWERKEGDASLNHLLTIIQTRSAAHDRFVPEAARDGFIDETDFGGAYLIVFQTIMQPARWLELGAIRREDDALLVAVLSKEPDGPYGDSASAHTLAIRVVDDRAGVPNHLTLKLDGELVTDGVIRV